MESNLSVGEERKTIERQTAMKVWIQHLSRGKYVENPGWEPNYVLHGELKIFRANILGIVVQKSNSKVLNYDYLVLDDGTGKIMVRAFENRELLNEFQIGNLVNIIGKPREYGSDIYLIPEIARQVTDSSWIEVRRKELEKLPILLTPTEEDVQRPAREEAPVIETMEEEIVTPKDKMISLIRELDRGEGVDVETVLSAARGTQAEKLLQNLLLHGDVFEIKPGRIKLLE